MLNTAASCSTVVVAVHKKAMKKPAAKKAAPLPELVTEALDVLPSLEAEDPVPPAEEGQAETQEGQEEKPKRNPRRSRRKLRPRARLRPKQRPRQQPRPKQRARQRPR